MSDDPFLPLDGPAADLALAVDEDVFLPLAAACLPERGFFFPAAFLLLSSPLSEELSLSELSELLLPELLLSLSLESSLSELESSLESLESLSDELSLEEPLLLLLRLRFRPATAVGRFLATPPEPFVLPSLSSSVFRRAT